MHFRTYLRTGPINCLAWVLYQQPPHRLYQFFAKRRPNDCNIFYFPNLGIYDRPVPAFATRVGGIKMKKIKPIRVSKTPPPGWPIEVEWKEIEKKLSKGLASKMLPQKASPVETVKHEICSHFIRYFNRAKMSQKEMAKQLDVTESRVSEILHYHHERFTIDKLLELLARIKPDVKVKVA